MNPLSLEMLQELNRGYAICAEIPASAPELRKWVKILPFKEDGAASYRYLVRCFELKREWVEQELDIAGYELNSVRREADDLATALELASDLLPGPVEWTCWRNTDCPV